jgi:hypothetical protein
VALGRCVVSEAKGWSLMSFCRATVLVSANLWFQAIPIVDVIAVVEA